MMQHRRPKHWWDRSRVVISLVAYAALAEYSAPTPFVNTFFGRLVYFLVLFFLVKEVYAYRAEKSKRVAKRVDSFVGLFNNRFNALPDFAKWRIGFVVRWIFIAYAFGFIIDGISVSCTGAIPCVFGIPRMVTANMPEILQFIIRIAISLGMSFLTLMGWSRQGSFDIIQPESIKIGFKDVYGQDNAVKLVKENLDMLERPDEIEGKGGYVPGGILLSGPPGTGKSMLAEAAAGHTGKPFVMVPPGFTQAPIVGQGQMKMRHLFKTLRKLALKYGGVVCFMDELDAMGARGYSVGGLGGGGGYNNGALQTMLTEMSGIAKPRGFYNRLRKVLGFNPVPPPKYRILFMAATNMPEKLDPALTREGRFDRKVKVGYPDTKGREATFRGYLGKVSHSLSDEQIATLARNNPRATGASIKDAVNEALIRATREGRSEVTWDDIRDTLIWKQMGEEEGRHTHEEDERRVAFHEAGHAVAAHHFRTTSRIQFASIIRRGQTGGVVASIPTDDRTSRTRQEMEADIMVALASVWAERTFFAENLSTGPSSDLQKATQIALAMVTKHAMGKFLTVFPDTVQPDADIWNEVENILGDAFLKLSAFLWSRKDQVHAVATALLDYGTVDGDEVHAICERLESNEG